MALFGVKSNLNLSQLGLIRMRFIFFILLVSCNGSRDNKPHAPEMTERLAALSAKRDLYCELSKPFYEQNLWVTGKCDGLLWTALHSLACGYGGVEQFESKDEPGRWYRNPEHDCFPNGSASDISKDMLQGLLLHMAKTKNKPMMERTLAYCEAHPVSKVADVACKMGEAKDYETEVSRTYWPITSVQILKDMIEYRGAKLTTTQEKTGFPAHLEFLGFQIKALVYGGINDGELKTLKAHADRVQRNSLFNGGYFLFSKNESYLERAVSFLEDKSHWPDDRLPSKRENHCASYLFQREDEPKDWQPCDDDEELNGTDFAYAVATLLGEINP